MELPFGARFLSSDGVPYRFTTTISAVVIEVADRDAPRPVAGVDVRLRLPQDPVELAVAQVPVQQTLLPEALADGNLVDGWVDVAIGDEDVLPSVVIEVEEGGSPAQLSRMYGHDAGYGVVDEDLPRAVPVEGGVSSEKFVLKMSR